MFPLVLLLTEVYAVMQKKCCKKNTAETLGPGGGKVILTLLAEVIIFHVGFTIIDIR